jgi:hypothetical protein
MTTILQVRDDFFFEGDQEFDDNQEGLEQARNFAARLLARARVENKHLRPIPINRLQSSDVFSIFLTPGIIKPSSVVAILHPL